MAKVRTGRRYRPGRADNQYDVIVIGSGIGGLTTAALLSLLGRKVCVLEQHYTAGGYTHVYERNGYEWDVGVHYIGDVHNPKSTLRRVFDVISQNRLKWAEMAPVYDRIIIDKQCYDFEAGRDNFTRNLQQRFPDEAETIQQYVDLIRKVSRLTPRFFAAQGMPRPLARLYNLIRPLVMPDVFFKTTREVLEDMTDNQALISVLTGQWGDYGQPPRDCAFLMHTLIAKHYMGGGAYPVGGPVEIARSIIPTIQASGGDVFTYAGVKQVLIEGNKAVGVQMTDGSEIRARQVVSNAGFMATMNHLLPGSTRQKIGVKNWLPQVHHSSAHLCLYAGFKGSSQELGLDTTNLWIYPSGDHEGNLETYLKDASQPFPLAYISFPSAKDPVWEKRYPGKSTVEVVTVANPDWFRQWEGTTWCQRGEDYETFKKQFAQRLLDILFKHRPQLQEKLDYYELSTPLSTRWFQWNEQGEIYGLDHYVDRFKKPFLHPATPVKGLYLTGADVMTAGIGGAMMGGLMATCVMEGAKARRVIQLLKKPPAQKKQAPEAIARSH